MRIEGRTLREEIERVVPWHGQPLGKFARAQLPPEVPEEAPAKPPSDEYPSERLRDGDDDLHDPAVVRDQGELLALLSLLDKHSQAVKAAKASGEGESLSSLLSGSSHGAHGADLVVHEILGHWDRWRDRVPGAR